LLLLVYSSTIVLPYLLLDETWLLRNSNVASDIAYPSIRFLVGLVQGRPIFLLLLVMTRGLVYLTSQTVTIQLLRLLAIFGLAFFSVQLYTLASRIKLSPTVSLPIAIGAVTLPAFQVFVGNATWLVIPLVLVTWCFIICFDFVMNEQNKTKLWRTLLKTLFLSGLVLATYQSLLLIHFALLLFVFLFGHSNISRKNGKRLAVFVCGITLLSLAIYYCAWKFSYHLLLGNFSESRYAPQNVSFESLIGKVDFLFTFRLRQALNLWCVNVFSNAYYLSLIAISLGFITKALLLPWKNVDSTLSSMGHLFDAILVCLLIMMVSDAIAMSAPQQLKSYTTLAALSLCCYFIITWSVLNIFTFLSSVMGYVKLSPNRALLFICLCSLLLAQLTVLRMFSIPNWVTTNVIEDSIRGTIEQGQTINKIIVYQAERPLDRLYAKSNNFYASEFNWLNLGDRYYVYWSLKSIFDHLQNNEMPTIVFIGSDNKQIIIENAAIPKKGETIAFDFRKGSTLKVYHAR
jgi:hypothetical protein